MRIASVAAAATVALAISALAPLHAQRSGDAAGPGEPGTEKPLSEQIEEAIRGFVESVEPALEQLRDTFRVFERIDSLEHYHEPEILPNGDIIIRRKEDAPPYEHGPLPEAEPEPGVRT